MSIGKDKLKRQQLLALALLILWLFGQMSISAHELLIEHKIEHNCKWLCQLNNHDDYAVESNVSTNTQVIPEAQTGVYISFDSLTIRFKQPLYRAPPL